MPQYALMSLNMPEQTSDYPMPQYNYNNIIIRTNVIMLEFLSA